MGFQSCDEAFIGKFIQRLLSVSGLGCARMNHNDKFGIFLEQARQFSRAIKQKHLTLHRTHTHTHIYKPYKSFWFNSLSPSIYASVKHTIIASDNGAKPLSEPMQPYCQLDPRENISVKFYLKLKKFILDYTLENFVCKMAAILSRPQCVKTSTEIIPHLWPATHLHISRIWSQIVQGIVFRWIF